MFILIILLILGVAHGASDGKQALPFSAAVRVLPQAEEAAAKAKAERRSVAPRVKSDEELSMEVQGLVNVKGYAPDIVVQLAYASSNNILHTQLYRNFNEAFLQKEAAQKLASAQRIVKSISPNLSLVVHDAARPQRIQQRCWELARARRVQYLFMSPKNISMHTYGVAVDVSLINLATRTELDMGGSWDNPGALAAPKREREMLRSGRLSPQQRANRLLLRRAMHAAGFTSISNEWWHFEACSRKTAQQRYRPII
jgi:D-alanyl-D-alanine dipeptidase